MLGRRKRTRVTFVLLACAIVIYFLLPAKVAVSSNKNRYKKAREPPKNHAGHRRRPPKRTHCKPRKNIVFVKTHKTGSSTVTNILHRYGNKHNLVFGLPRPGQYRLDWPWTLQNNSFQLTNGIQPNIVCHHGRYNRAILESIMPRDTVYVTILRHPVSQYESTFSYMGLDKLLGIENKTNPVELFLEKPTQFLVNYVLNKDLRVNSDRLKLIQNGMSFDLGLNSTYFDNKTQIKTFLKTLRKEFDLVMLAEFFEESIILLKDLLCWPLEAFSHFSLNVRYQNASRTIFSQKTIDDMQRWNNVDFQTYEQFREILMKKIASKTKSKGERFHAELQALRRANRRQRKLCLRNVTKTSTIQYGVVVRRLELNVGLKPEVREMCDQMRRNDVDYIKLLRKKQSGDLESMVVGQLRNTLVTFLKSLLGYLSKK